MSTFSRSSAKGTTGCGEMRSLNSRFPCFLEKTRKGASGNSHPVVPFLKKRRKGTFCRSRQKGTTGCGDSSGKQRKETRKSQQKPLRKRAMGNTIEQYAGLNSCAASSFSKKTSRVSRKSENRPFPRFEQYAGLESRLCRDPLVQAARGRVPAGSLGPGYPGYPGYPGKPESRRLAVPGVTNSSSLSGRNGRLGPPDSAGIRGTHAFGRKRPKDGFGGTIEPLPRVPPGEGSPWTPSVTEPGTPVPHGLAAGEATVQGSKLPFSPSSAYAVGPLAGASLVQPVGPASWAALQSTVRL